MIISAVRGRHWQPKSGCHWHPASAEAGTPATVKVATGGMLSPARRKHAGTQRGADHGSRMLTICDDMPSVGVRKSWEQGSNLRPSGPRAGRSTTELSQLNLSL